MSDDDGDREQHANGRSSGLGDWVRHLPVAAVVLDHQGVALVWNARAAQVLGWSGRRSLRRLGGAGVPWFERLRAATSTGESAHAVITRTRRDERIALELAARRLPAGDLLVMLHDVTALVTSRRRSRRLERRLRRVNAVVLAGHERMRLITDMVRDHATVTLDPTGHVVSWNAGARRVTGFNASQVMARPFATLLHDDAATIGAFLRAATAGGRHEMELELRRADGSLFHALLTACPLHDDHTAVSGFVLVIRDMTEALRAAERLRRSEAQLQHAEKMDAVGRLAAGIAHDFNNVLTAIHGHVEFLLEELPTGVSARSDVEEIRKAADRAASLTRQLLTFAREQVIEPVALDLNHIIREVEKLLRRLMDGGITLETMLAPDLPPIFADPGQIEQAIVNLIVNARDAMTDGGMITIRTDIIQFDESYSARGLDLPPGEYVQFAVRDTGVGMTPDIQRQIFEPFFTTKREGTGLGLPNVYGIVKQSGGHISVYSEPGVGTTFKIFFPVYTGEAVVVKPTAAAAHELAAGTVLLVEDDDAVRGLVRRTLHGNGYTVVEANDGEEALTILRQRSSAIDVVVTDVNMPKMTGYELADRVADVQPRAGVVIMSGFPEEGLARGAAAPNRRRFLEKPFTPVSLVRAVRDSMQE